MRALLSLALYLSLTSAALAAHNDYPTSHRRITKKTRRPWPHAPLHVRDDSATTALAFINSTLANKEASTTSLAKGSIAAGSDPSSASSCFPALDFQMPDSVPSSLDNWWCDPSTEYAFMGFSYEVTACQSPEQLQKEFKDIRETYNSRYVRLYGTCDNEGFYNDIVDAAWNNGLGVHSLIWFGFTGGNQWQTRRDALFSALHSNPKAPFVTRVVQFGSEPLFDNVLPPSTLAAQVTAAKQALADVGVPVTVSELAYGYQERWSQNAASVLAAIDSVNAHMLPFFSAQASTGDAAWPLVLADLDWYMKNAPGKKIYMDENAWPSIESSGVQANSAFAVANIFNEQAYYNLLDSKCSYFKETNDGIGWFFHIYSDSQEPGYGLYTTSGKKKFAFAPKTEC
jgi:exo-beta-1,3-glucanase (GH17 family)